MLASPSDNTKLTWGISTTTKATVYDGGQVYDGDQAIFLEPNTRSVWLVAAGGSWECRIKATGHGCQARMSWG